MPDETVEIQIRTTANTAGAKETAKALDDVKKASKGVAEESKATGEAGSQAMQDVGEKVSWVTQQKQLLRGAAKGLRDEFPVLSHVARLAVNPIALAVAGIGAAWAIWNQRVKEATSLLAGAELPKVDPIDVGHVNAMADAWANYNVQLGHARATYEGVAAAAERSAKAMAAMLENQKQLNEAMHGADTAKVDAEVAAGKISKVEGERQKLAANVEAIRAKAAVELAGEQGKVDNKEAEAVGLMNDAADKKEKAAKIHLASAEDDAKTLTAYKAAADAAKKDQDERREWQKRIAERQSGQMPWQDRPGFAWDYYFRYGLRTTGTEAYGIEQQGIESDQNVIDAYNARSRAAFGRNIARGERQNLLQRAGEEEAKGEQMYYEEAPADRELLEQKRATVAQTTLLETLKEGYKAVAEGEKAADQVAKEINSRIKEGVQQNAALLQALEEQRQFNREVWDAIEKLQQQTGGMRSR